MIDNNVSNKSFVLVGGDISLINSLEQALLSSGAAIFAATSGSKGFSLALNNRPDLLVVEDTVDDYDISTLVANLQLNELTNEVPILIITDKGDGVYSELFANGRKPFRQAKGTDIDELVSKIKDIISSHQDNHENEMLDISESDLEISNPDSVDDLRVLLVEDDPLLRNLLSMKLQKSNIAHSFCNSGLDALSMIKEYNPTTIILDLMLPGKNGLEVLKDIREDANYKNIPVVIFSNKDDDADRATARELGVNHFLIKATTDLSELISLIIKLKR